jgi:anti-sigma regulatory factor (Ser/Thr protein kinase)
MEFARDLDDGERRIEEAIRTLAREDIDHLAAALMKAVLGEDEPTDDIAILTVTIDRLAAPLPGDEREWRFVSNDYRTGAMVRRDVREVIAEWTQREETRFAAELAFGELIANAVRHAPGPVRVLASTDGASKTTLVVEDAGPGFTHDERGVDPYAETGRGLGLVRAVSDGVRIEPTALGGTRVTVTFEHARGPAAVPALATTA